MVVYGRELSERITKKLKQEIKTLTKKGITPKLVIITLGIDKGWQHYVAQKIRLAGLLGIKTELTNLQSPTAFELKSLIGRLNRDNYVHGIVVQRPLPQKIDKKKVTLAINPKKDIDGFRDDSKFRPPIFLAVEEMLRYVIKRNGSSQGTDPHKERILTDWLNTKNIVVVGKGETGGGAVINELLRLGIKPEVIDSRTEKQKKLKILKRADVIISAVGKKRIVKPTEIKRGVILIGIGLHRDADGKLHGDYDEDEIDNIASFYTPTPGGVGPLNLAFLFKNLIESAKQNR